MAGTQDAASWTTARIDLLLKLEKEGLSASQIAQRLGGGVTRSGVIGKIHRLLGGRTTQPPRSPRTTPPARSPSAGHAASAEPAQNQPAPPPAAAIAAPPAPAAAPVSATAPVPAAARAPRGGGIVRLADLRGDIAGGGRQCRFPIGDPGDAAFGYCGARTAVAGMPYCGEHARLCYQPRSEERRRARA